MATAVLESPVATGFSSQAFEQFVTTRQEPHWVAAQRRESFELYQERRFTPLDPEEWKRVDLRTFKPESFSIASSDDAPDVATLMRERAQFAGVVRHVDGRCRESSINSELAAKGVLFGDLAELLKSHGDKLKPYLMSAIRPGVDRFTAWHSAFCTGGTVLFVPRNVTIDAPLFSLIALATNNAADFSHTLVILEDGASATLLEETASVNAEYSGLHIGSVELIVGEGAHLRYVQLQNWNMKSWHFAHQAGRVARNGSLQWTVGGLGAKLAHVHQTVDLDGPGAEAQVNGVTFATDRQVLSYYTQQTHHAPNTQSDLLYKDVLRDRSRVVWRGMIKVDPGAQKTDGYQRNDSLILTETARCDAIPGLEIEADDVRCTHGATAGQVDVEQVFYLMCRGLSKFEAMHMIVKGFFQTVTDRIPVEIVRDTLDKAVEKKLGIGDA